MELNSGSRVAIVGGGPAGSFTAYFLLKFSRMMGIELRVDIYEPKDFDQPGAKGCNYCGGVVYASLIQFLAVEGISIPSEVVMNAIDSYCLHTDTDQAYIPTPMREMSIAAVYRGGGPKGVPATSRVPVVSFDGALFAMAKRMGARHVPERVVKLEWDGDRPRLFAKEGESTTYDFLVGAVGINGTGIKLFQQLGIGYEPPSEIKCFILDVHLGVEAVERYIGNTMHIFLLDIPGINQGAIIPKGPFATLCYVATEVTNELTDRFLNHPEVRRCLPPEWQRPSNSQSCMCIPSTIVGDPVNYYADRVVMVGDCGVARLFKDGIGSAYRTAKACATTAILWGIAQSDFEQHFRPHCDRISRDNSLGHKILKVISIARGSPLFSRAMIATTREEGNMDRPRRIMSLTLYDAFSGSLPYYTILTRILGNPGFMVRFFRALMTGLMERMGGKGPRAPIPE